MDSHLLSRLLTKIDKIVALQVGLLQIGDVYQRHATGVETEEEYVARQGSEGIRGQFGRLYLLQLLGIDSSLHGFGYAGIDSGEWMVLWRKSLFHRLIVDGAQVAHIERGGVGAKTLFFQIGLITEHL